MLAIFNSPFFFAIPREHRNRRIFSVHPPFVILRNAVTKNLFTFEGAKILRWRSGWHGRKPDFDINAYTLSGHSNTKAVERLAVQVFWLTVQLTLYRTCVRRRVWVACLWSLSQQPISVPKRVFRHAGGCLTMLVRQPLRLRSNI